MDTKSKTRGVEAYRRTEVVTANRENVLLMLYGGALRYLRCAIEAGQRGDNPERNRLVIRVQDIVSELRSVLDFKIGGEIATELDRLYEFVSSSLVKGTMENDLTRLESALKVLETLNSAWEEAVSSLKKQKEG